VSTTHRGGGKASGHKAVFVTVMDTKVVPTSRVLPFGFGDYHSPGPGLAGAGAGARTGTGAESGSSSESVSTLKPTSVSVSVAVKVYRAEVDDLCPLGLGILGEPCSSFREGKLALAASLYRVI